MESDRLLLIPFTEKHFQAIMNANFNELAELLQVMPMTSWTEFYPEESLHAYYGIYNSLNGDLRWGSYFVILKSEAKLVGTCCFKGIPGESGAEIGYEISSADQGKGYASETVNTLCNFARENGLHAIQAHTLPEENASVVVLRKNNFKFMGQIKDDEDGVIWHWQLIT